MPWLNNSIALAVALIGVMVVLACTEICYIEHGNGADMDRKRTIHRILPARWISILAAAFMRHRPRV